ncbi:hypothetical protein LEN26_003806 [Aphanomyces euteiches]|nr:hypothetical protein LEN26_003806 [Aphanomyces euteiches]
MSHPSLSADRSGEYEEKSAEWFELFLDLIMVAACSSISEKLRDDLSFHGFLYFSLLATLFTMTWMLYTSFHARFNEKSLLHYLFLYIWLVGLGGMVLAGKPGPTFTFGLLLVRIAQLFMRATMYIMLPRTRHKICVHILVGLVSVATLYLSLYLPPSWTIPCYLIAIAVEAVGPLAIPPWVRWYRAIYFERIPMNIDHYKERMGSLVMLTLGEAILSAIIGFKDPSLLTVRYFIMMELALLVLFSMAMFYFAMQPLREFHALRRSLALGTAFTYLHIVLFPALLAMGVSLKFITNSVLKNESLDSTHVAWLFGSISASMFIMLLIRLTHFGGRRPAPSDPEHMKRITNANVWWTLVGFAPLVPIVCAWLLHKYSRDSINPISALVLAAGFNLVFTIIETLVMNVLVDSEPRVSENENARLLDETPDYS